MGDENSIPSPRGYYYNHAPKTYALSGKIMLSAIVILFTVVLFILCLHLYARCFLLRRRRQEILRRRRAHVFSSADPIAVPGLAAAVLRSLPVFVFSSNTHKEPLECAVCLSEFQENEKGRLLPKCNHSFHIECIDMWFHSHATCPLCRADVEIPASAAEIVTGGDVESGSGSETASSFAFCESCRDEEGVRSLPSSSSDPAASSSESSRRKGLEFAAMRVEVPRRSEWFRGTAPEEEMIRISPAGQGLKSPGSRILSLKKILSKDRRFSPTAFSCSSGQEIDLERGEEESQLQR